MKHLLIWLKGVDKPVDAMCYTWGMNVHNYLCLHDEQGRTTAMYYQPAAVQIYDTQEVKN